tara:strand:+ start:388 stop:957 length:570 start_codon:yes stop_codon:yes gene_type:complete
MTNSWSFLFDELNMSNQDYWKEDGFSLTGNPGTASPDTIVFGSSRLPGGMGNDHITFSGDGINAAQPVPFNYFGAESEDTLTFDLSTPSKPSTNPRQKYGEDVIIKELQDYITRTYDQHYSAGSDKIQTLDLIEACGDGEAFCRSNILKYASRYDKKGTARRDIMKILHYAVLLMHFNDKNAQSETYPQ